MGQVSMVTIDAVWPALKRPAEVKKSFLCLSIRVDLCSRICEAHSFITCSGRAAQSLCVL